MADPHSPFDSDYGKGSQTQAPEPGEGEEAPSSGSAVITPLTGSLTASGQPVVVTDIGTARSQTSVTGRSSSVLPPVEQLVDSVGYETGKPKRIVIRAKIIRG